MITNYNILPYLLTGENVGIARMLDELKDWTEEKTTEEFDKIPGRYFELLNEELSSYAELIIYVDLINFLKEQDYNYYLIHTPIITEARSRLVNNHNRQFKNESSHSKLSEES